jgi:hypothetical protein
MAILKERYYRNFGFATRLSTSLHFIFIFFRVGPGLKIHLKKNLFLS